LGCDKPVRREKDAQRARDEEVEDVEVGLECDLHLIGETGRLIAHWPVGVDGNKCLCCVIRTDLGQSNLNVGRRESEGIVIELDAKILIV
jgi:hypothetical protein